MEKEQRNLLYNTVVKCRRLLEEDFSKQLEGNYGVRASGTMEPLDNLGHLDAVGRADWQAIAAANAHFEAVGATRTQAAQRYIRESAFTFLNRLAALKLMEHPSRALIQPSLVDSNKSRGFTQFSLISPEAMRSQPDGGYRLYLELLFDDLGQALGVLFDRTTPTSILFASQPCLQELLGLLNAPELGEIWGEDETIGWIYQYFTPTELREEARRASSAPRNSYELAFRNQFYTPRYVVEFLTDNTLGRTWWQMRSGDTSLVDSCRYLLHRPEDMEPRLKRDPRTLRVLDPASGSGHFLLYCFDLLLIIYEEAYDDPELGPVLQTDYPDRTEFRRQVPRLILAHNLHGIDIDRRAAQIAALALWLRAQRAYADLNVRRQDRPRIEEIHLVCAEPMPGEYELLGEFVKELKPAVLGNMLRDIWEKMKLAGEVGSLLKIEQEIQTAISDARRKLAEMPAAIQLGLFGGEEQARAFAERPSPALMKDEAFWDEAEERVLKALRHYAEVATTKEQITRRLFAADAAKGIAFIDLLQQPFDVVLMNPPFGAATKNAKPYIIKRYPRTKNDLYAAFVERGLDLLAQGGFLGAITSRTGFFLKYFQKWREEILVNEANFFSLADLGQGVLDSATVETAAYAVERMETKANSATFFRLLEQPRHTIYRRLLEQIRLSNEGTNTPGTFVQNTRQFSLVPGSPFTYWSSNTALELFGNSKALAETATATVGASTKNDFQYLRAWWEIPPGLVGSSREQTRRGCGWVPFAKGGGYSPYYYDVHLLIDWLNDGADLKEFISEYRASRGWGNQWSAEISGHDYYFRRGLTWPRRTDGFSIRILPEGCIFSEKGPAIFKPHDDLEQLLVLLSIANSEIFGDLIKLRLARTQLAQSYEVGLLQQTPIPQTTAITVQELAELARDAYSIQRQFDKMDETSHAFCLSFSPSALSLADLAVAQYTIQRSNETALAEVRARIDELVSSLYGVAREDLNQTPSNDAVAHQKYIRMYKTDTAEVASLSNLQTSAAQMLSWSLGAAFGYWDVRLALNPALLPKLQEPFDPLPRCAPGALIGADELPATNKNIASEAWLAARENVLTRPDLPLPNGEVATISSEQYPLIIPWDGILVDDPSHPADLVNRVRQVLTLVWGDRAGAIEKESCEILGYKRLRDYFRDSRKGFFAFHIKRYSKSRRKAPIYWLLQSDNRNYAIWLYYHRVDDTTYFTAARDYADTKVNLETARLNELRQGLAALSSSAQRSREREIDRQQKLATEVTNFRNKLDDIALRQLPPDHNDGVIISIAPLWELVPWRDAGKMWQDLVAGKYEWSTMAQQMRQRGLVKE